MFQLQQQQHKIQLSTQLQFQLQYQYHLGGRNLSSHMSAITIKQFLIIGLAISISMSILFN